MSTRTVALIQERFGSADIQLQPELSEELNDLSGDKFSFDCHLNFVVIACRHKGVISVTEDTLSIMAQVHDITEDESFLFDSCAPMSQTPSHALCLHVSDDTARILVHPAQTNT